MKKINTLCCSGHTSENNLTRWYCLQGNTLTLFPVTYMDVIDEKQDFIIERELKTITYTNENKNINIQRIDNDLSLGAGHFM